MCHPRIKQHEDWVAFLTNEPTEKMVFEQVKMRDLVLRCSEISRQRKQPGQQEEREMCLKATPKGFSDRLDGEVWEKKRSHGGLQGFGGSNWKDGEDITDTGEGQGWNEVWGKGQRPVLNSLDWSCLVGVPLKMWDTQSPVQE